MNKLLFAAALVVLTACGSDNTSPSDLATSPAKGYVAGKTYCRNIEVPKPTFGVPAGTFKRCVAFGLDNKVTDNSSNFFGNPPMFGTYTIEAAVVKVKLTDFHGKSFEDVWYTSLDSTSIQSDEGEVLKLVKKTK